MKHLILVSLLIAGLSGCLNDESGSSGDSTEIQGESLGFDADDGPTGQGSSSVTPADHGEPRIDEGPVASRQEGALYIAEQTITIDNDFGGAEESVIGLSLPVGDLRIEPSPDDEYHLVLVLSGYGGTAADADQALEAIEWTHTDHLDGTLQLTTVIDGPDQGSFGCFNILVLQYCRGAFWSADLVAQYPAGPAHSLTADGSSTDILASGLKGALLDLDTSSGDINVDGWSAASAVFDASSGDVSFQGLRVSDLDVSTSSGDIMGTDVVSRAVALRASSGDISIDDLAAEDLAIETSSGQIGISGSTGSLIAESSSGDQTFDLVVADAVLSSSSGTIEANLDPSHSGQYRADATSGDVVLRLDDGTDHAYRIEVETSSGDESVTVAPGGDGRYESPGFEDAAIQTTIFASTSSGDVTVTG